MKEENKLIKLYRAILRLGNMEASETGEVSGRVLPTDEKTHPVTIKGKRLVLPLDSQLRNTDWENRVVFHPLRESPIQDESEVFEKYRKLVLTRINTTLGIVCTNLMTLAASTEVHSKLNPDQLAFLKNVKNVNEKALVTFKKLMEETSMSGAKTSLVHIFVRRGAIIKGTKHPRGGIVTFPVYEAMKEEGPVLNVKLSKKEREVFMGLFEFIFPMIGEKGAYDQPSSTSIAPMFEALVKTALGIGLVINETIELFKEQIEQLEVLLFADELSKDIANLKDYEKEIMLIPTQPGNEGAVIGSGLKVSNNEAAPVKQKPASEMTLNERLNQASQRNAANPQHYYNQPQQFQPQQFQQQQPQVVRTERGVDFSSLLRSNQQLASAAQAASGFAAAISGGNNPHGGLQFHQQNNVPLFARMNNSSNMGGNFGGGYRGLPQV